MADKKSPETSFQVPPRPRWRRLAINLPWDKWPEPDRAVWARAERPTTSFEEDEGRIAHWRPSTRDAAHREYSCWLGFLAERGDLDPKEDPGSRITPGRARAYVMSMSERCSSVSVTNSMARLAMVASALFPDHDWTWLRRIRAGLQKLAKPTRRKVGRIPSPRDLMQLGEHLMTVAEEKEKTRPHAAALLYRDGLLIAMLALAPIRRANLVSLEIGRQFLSTERSWTIRLTGAETKSRRPFEIALPAALSPAIERYLKVHRAYLVQRGHAHTTRLWLGQTGKPVAPLRIWQILTQHTRTHLGVSVNPHLARDAAVTALGEEAPKTSTWPPFARP